MVKRAKAHYIGIKESTQQKDRTSTNKICTHYWTTHIYKANILESKGRERETPI